MKKRKIFSIILTLVIWFFMFYTMLPAINIQSQEFWSFAIVMVAVAVVINSYSIIREIVEKRYEIPIKERLKQFKVVVFIFGALAVVYVGGTILSSPIVRASAYRDLLTVEDSTFEEDIQEVDYTSIPLLDSASSALLAEREMGSMIDMVSQYEVSSNFSQINYQNKPVRVTPLKYSGFIKWLTNRNVGIPAYIKIDMATQDVELVKLEEGIKISPSELFNRNLDRYLRFRYPTAMFMTKNFEIDDNGTPYWICPIAEKTIGLFGGTDIKGAVMLNAITGEHEYYDIKDIPPWVDKVYNSELLIQQYDYHGTLVNGYINSLLSQKGCLKTTEGYNYMVVGDDVWVYTGITSVTGDESIVGFVLMNQRTKETHYYQISGAKEYSAMRSAEGQVQHLGYNATFPLLINVGGEPTYIFALKDASGLVKKYAMVNIEKYQIVAIGDSISECERNYGTLMVDNGITIETQAEGFKYSGTIEEVWNIVIDGNTYCYMQLEGIEDLFEVAVKDNISVIKAEAGDEVSIEGYDDMRAGIIVIRDIMIEGKKPIDVELPIETESEPIGEEGAEPAI